MIIEENYCGRERRNPGIKKYHQYDGGPVELIWSEVTRVAREVGSEGKLGGRPKCPA